MTATIANNILQFVTDATRDDQARIEALDVTRSFIVKAPAGSGKTELLTRRFLALLGVVEKPEDILAITFTRAATAEMRDRVLKALRDENASRLNGIAAQNIVARAALEQSENLGWALLDQPHRLNIQTIDSLCLQIAHEAPLLSRLGGQLQPTEDAQPLYERAARRTLEQLGGGSETLTGALSHLLRLRDINVADCERLIASMLARRDQWLADFSSTTTHDDTDWPALRSLLEEPFRRERSNVLHAVRQYLHRHQAQTERLLHLAAYACSNEPKHPILQIKDILNLEQLEHPEHFSCLRHFLLTKDGEWRKSITKAIGFPTEKDGGSKKHKTDFETLLQELATIDGLLEALCALDGLPNEQFADEEWRTIRSIITVLLHAAAQLRVAFGENSVIDFVEAGIDAQHALLEPEVQRGWSNRIHHLLVDEFQDTSRRQYELIAQIVADWDADEHRTCFLVGDPMQSIYLFRQADLALFSEVQANGFGERSTAIAFDALTLRRNFRSDAGVVAPLNEMFSALGEMSPNGASIRAHFAPAVANAGTSEAKAVWVNAHFDDGANATAEHEASRIVDIVRTHQQAIEQARTTGEEFRVAILVRAKKHVALIASALRDAGIDYRAVEIETLEERQEIIDLASLLRALLSPLDRIAWLSILRAPWSGLSLPDLHILAGADDKALLGKPIPELLATRLPLLSEDGASRAKRVAGIMQLAVSQRFSGQFNSAPNGFAAWVERTWTSLGGGHCVDEDAYQNVQAFFQLISSLSPDGSEATAQQMTQRLRRLFAQPSAVTTEKSGVQLMTIHKAKGLGFDVVIVPALERIVGRIESPLIHWMERTRKDSSARELLIAPIGTKGAENSATYKWVCDQRRKEEDEELNRLLYVACTRARKELHLFGTIGMSRDEQQGASPAKIGKPKPRSLLAVGWPWFEQFFNEQFMSRQIAMASSAQSGPFLVTSLETLPGKVEKLAAAASPGQLLQRLPSGWNWSPGEAPSLQQAARRNSDDGSDKPLIPSPAQANGVAVHALFQQIASLAADDPRTDPSRTEDHWMRIALALLRHAGMSGSHLGTQAEHVVKLLLAATKDQHGQWILGQRQQAKSESRWTSRQQGALRTVRADRVFIAGSEPLLGGETHLWIVDYKTTAFSNSDGDLLLQQERSKHEQQLADYGRVLRAALPCDLPLRFALYYPSLPRLDWWEPA